MPPWNWRWWSVSTRPETGVSHPGARNTAGRLLACLKAAGGEYVSGTALGTSLGISRTAIWKQVRTLKGEGYEIESYPHLGYRLLSPPGALSAREIEDGLGTRWLGRPVLILAEADSTNRVAMQSPELGHGALVAAHAQKAGRGRLGRQWCAPEGTVPFSLVLCPALAPDRAPLLTLATGLGLVRGIADATGVRLDIKWPNDLLWRGRKVAGILTEVRSDPDRIVRAVVGVGLNVNTDIACLPPEVAGRAASVAEAVGEAIDPNRLMRGILAALEAVYDELMSASTDAAVAAILDRYRNHCATIGREVTVSHSKGVSTVGIAVAVDAGGALVVETPGGDRSRVFSGDVTLTGKHPEANP